MATDRKSITFVKDPSAVLDYGFKWTDWLNGDTITTSTWTVSAGLTKGADDVVGGVTSVWLSGGTQDVYTVTNTVVTQAGRTDERSFTVRVQER